MKDVYKLLTEAAIFDEIEITENNEIALPTGCAWEDEQTEFIQYIVEENKHTFLTDKRQTLDCLDKFFELTDPRVIKRIRAVTDYYGLGMRRQNLVLPIDSIDDFTKGYLKLLFCTSFLNSMEIFQTQNKGSQ